MVLQPGNSLWPPTGVVKNVTLFNGGIVTSQRLGIMKKVTNCITDRIRDFYQVTICLIGFKWFAISWSLEMRFVSHTGDMKLLFAHRWLKQTPVTWGVDSHMSHILLWIIYPWNLNKTQWKIIKGFASLEIPSRELTYPQKMAFWRWFSFSQGGICQSPGGYVFCIPKSMRETWPRPPVWPFQGRSFGFFNGQRDLFRGGKGAEVEGFVLWVSLWHIWFYMLAGGFKYVFSYFHLNLGKWSNLTNGFFKGVETTN